MKDGNKGEKTETMTEVSSNILVITVNVSGLISADKDKDCQAHKHCHLHPQTLLYVLSMPHILLCSIQLCSNIYLQDYINMY